MNRRAFLTAVGGIVGSTAGCISPGNPLARYNSQGPIPAGPTVSLQPVVTGPDPAAEEGVGPRFPTDLAVTDAGDRWFVVDRPGLVWSYGRDRSDGQLALDLSDRVLTNKEQGMFAVALHPEFAENGRLYLRYSEAKGDDMPADYSHAAVLSEFRVAEDGRRIRPDSERRLLEVAEPGPHHNGGALAFGPDGYLYASYGEGQWAEYPTTPKQIKQAEDWYEWTLGGNAQDTEENLLGSVLRIDVDSRTGDRAYGIPSDNPLVGREGLDEHFAWGFRNPWRMGFSDGDLYVADVGEYAYEEVSRVRKGGNYGWNVKEGTTCFNGSKAGIPGPWCPDETPDGEPLRDPVIQYAHKIRTGDGYEDRYSAVIGGFVYDGGTVGSLGGQYVFGDFTGQLLAATPSGGDGLWPIERVSVNRRFPGVLLSMNRDADGELLVLTGGATGRISRIVPPGAGGGSDGGGGGSGGTGSGSDGAGGGSDGG